MPYDPDNLNHRRALATHLIGALERAGFEPDPNARGERTYQRRVEGRPGAVLRVFTTVPLDGLAVRGNGRDAIRVVALYCGLDGKVRSLGSEKRVFRVGESPEAIADRAIERCREAYRRVKQRPRCRKCGAVTFIAKGSGRDTCAAICWARSNDPAVFDPDDNRLSH